MTPAPTAEFLLRAAERAERTAEMQDRMGFKVAADRSRQDAAGFRERAGVVETAAGTEDRHERD